MALQSLNAPIVRYLPLRPYSLVLWFLTGLVPIFGLLTLQVWSADIEQRLGHDAARPFVLTNRGSLAAWLSSVTLGFSVAVILGIYSVRRHRRDDHRGRFTVWRLGMLAAIVASMDAVTGIHDSVQQAVRLYVAPGSMTWHLTSWPVLWAGLFGAIMVRLLLEMKTSRGSITWMTLAAVCYGWSGVVELEWFTHHDWMVTSQFATLLLGHHFVLFSLVRFARDIVLEAKGMSAAGRHGRAASGRQRRETQAAEAQTAPALRVSMAESTREEKLPPAVSPRKQERPQLNVHAPDADVPARSLSKAERRRLRKEQRKKAA